MCRAWLGWCFAELGQFSEGLALAEEGARIAETLDHPFSITVACWGLGLLHSQRGDIDDGIAVLERALRLCREGPFLVLFPWTAAWLGYGYALAGRAVEVQPLFSEAAEKVTSMKGYAFHAIVLALTADALLLGGQFDEAIVRGEQALALARERGERGTEARILRLLGDARWRAGESGLGAAEAYYREAMALTVELGMRPLAAHCHLGLGTFYRRTGEREQARERFTTATTMYREMDMRFWLDQAEAALNDLR